MKKKILCFLLIGTVFIFSSGCSNRTQQQVALRDEGIKLLDEGNYEQAIEYFDKALIKSVGRVGDLEIDIDYYKAAAYFKSGDVKSAVSTYTALIEYDSGNPQPYFLRGCLYANAGKIKKAISDYNHAISKDKKDYGLYIQIYENLDALGYTDEGNKYLKKALDCADNSSQGMYYKGRIYYINGQPDKALEYLSKASKKNVDEANLYLAKIYQDQGEWDKAQKLLASYASGEDVTSEALGTLGDIEMANSNYEGALSYYQTGLNHKQVTNYNQLYKGACVALEGLKRYDEARAMLLQYIKLYPNDEAAQRELIFLESQIE